ncbi:MAG: cytochrome c maturation protein CcmE [Ignavibacteriaceae bacterium]
MRSKYIFGAVIVTIFLGLMVYLFTQSNIQYEEDFAKIKTSDKTFKATGAWVKNKNYHIDKEKRTFSFVMADAKGVELPVVFDGTIPNNFETATSVVVTGQYKDGYFHAKDILTKCPSKYEEEYKEEKINASGI